MKKISFLRLSLLLTIAIAGCAPHRSDPSGTPDNSSAVSDKNPFQAEDEMSAGVLGSIGHSPVNPKVKENGERQPFVYEGSEMNISYQVHASGRVKNVGFLVFVDGVAQPYKVDSSTADYETMHIFDLPEDDKEYPFSFVYEPVTGTKGDTLSMMIVSVYAPDFMPDMQKTRGYGGYHGTLVGDYQIHFEQDAKVPDTAALPKYKKLLNVKQSTEPITQEYLDSLSVFFRYGSHHPGNAEQTGFCAAVLRWSRRAS